jgi:hypothetical protein
LTKSNSINPIWTPFTIFNIGRIDKNDKFCYDISNHNINYEILVENKKEIIYKIPMIEKKISRESPKTILKNKNDMITAILMNIDETKMFYIPIYIVIKAIEKKSLGIHIKDFDSKFITHKEMGIKIPNSLNDMIECDIGVNEIKELGRIVITKEIKKNVETIGSLHQIISS